MVLEEDSCNLIMELKINLGGIMMRSGKARKKAIIEQAGRVSE